MKNIAVLLFVLCLLSATAFAAELEGQAVIVSLLNQDPDPAFAGDIVEVRFSLENRGDVSADDYMVEVLPKFPFDAVPGEDLAAGIGSLSPSVSGDNMKIVKFKIRVDRDANAGTYILPVMVYEEGKRNENESRNFNIEIESQESAEIIYIDQVELVPGKITPMKFTINNVGSSPLRELSFRWENADDIILPVGSDNTRYVKYIDVGDSAVLNYNVVASASATPNLYKLDLVLTYNDPATNTDKEISTIAGVYVGGATDFDVAFSGTSNGESSFSVSNIGSVAASSVTVSIPKQQGWSVSGTNSVIIGNLNEGDYTIASFTLQSSGSSQRNFSSSGSAARRVPGSTNISDERMDNAMMNQSQASSIKVDVTYTDSRGNRNTITKDVPISSSSSASASSEIGAAGAARFSRQQVNPLVSFWNNGKWIIMLVAIAGIFLYMSGRVKKERMKNPDYNYRKLIRDILSFGKKKK